ncbi:MAG: hypothetical protein ACREBA_07380 [Nitrosotalea sp.]
MVIPLVENLYSTNKTVDQERQRIAILNQNITYLSILTDSDIDQKINLANLLFPQTKDFNDTLQALNAAAVSSTASIENFSFDVGGVSGKQPTDATSNTLDITVTLQGSTESIVDFVQALDTKIPLMNVESIDISQSTTTLQIQVAYKPYVQQQIDLTKTVLTPSAASQALLQQAAEWQTESVASVAASPSESASGSGTLPPF